MELLLLFERGLEAAALLRDGVQDDGAVELLEEAEGLDEHRQIVAVDGAVVAEAELFEDHAAADDALGGLFGLARDVARSLAAELFDEAGGAIVQADVGGVGGDLVQVLGDGPDVLVDGPLVVVEHDDHALGLRGDVVQRLEADAVSEGGVAGERDDVFLAAGHVARDGHAKRGGERGARVTGAEAVVLAFGAEHEAVEALGLADGVEAVFASGEQLVDVALVADVEDEAVAGSIEDVVHGDGQLDHAQVRPDVTAGLGDAGDEAVADLFGQPL